MEKRLEKLEEKFDTFINNHFLHMQVEVAEIRKDIGFIMIEMSKERSLTDKLKAAAINTIVPVIIIGLALLIGLISFPEKINL